MDFTQSQMMKKLSRIVQTRSLKDQNYENREKEVHQIFASADFGASFPNLIGPSGFDWDPTNIINMFQTQWQC